MTTGRMPSQTKLITTAFRRLNNEPDRHTLKYVLGSQLFKGLPVAFDKVGDLGEDFGRADNDMTFVEAGRLADLLEEDAEAADDEDEASEGEADPQVVTAVERLRALANDVYIDLEN